MHLNDFDFILPPDLIAQEPAARRDQSRLMIVHRAQQRITHDVFSNITHYLRPGDVLVVNDTKVIPARLHGYKAETGGRIEVLLLHERGNGAWEVLLRPTAKVTSGTVVIFGDGLLQGEVDARHQGAMVMRFTPADILAILDKYGEVPLPPYIKRSATGAARRGATDRHRH